MREHLTQHEPRGQRGGVGCPGAVGEELRVPFDAFADAVCERVESEKKMLKVLSQQTLFFFSRMVDMVEAK